MLHPFPRCIPSPSSPYSNPSYLLLFARLFGGVPRLAPLVRFLGVVIILVMDVLVWMTIVKFKDVDIWSARLLIPYEAWLWIASTLNIYLALNN